MAARYARENKIPYLGICLGLQIAVIEFARHVAGLLQANSMEFEPNTSHPVIALVADWVDTASGDIQKRSQASQKGGTMRLGAQTSHLVKNTHAREIYQSDAIKERHRHRYEVNETYVRQLEAAGLCVSGRCDQGELVEIIELRDHPWYLSLIHI